jgi:hypothetical protein
MTLWDELVVRVGRCGALVVAVLYWLALVKIFVVVFG